MVISTWQAVNKVKFGDEIVHISTTVRATAKPFTPMCSPSGSDNQKNCDFPIWTTLWPYFFIPATWWTQRCKWFCRSSNGCWDTHNFIFKFYLIHCLSSGYDHKKIRSQVVQIGKSQFFWLSLPLGEHKGVNGFAVALTIVEIRTISSSNFTLFTVCQVAKTIKK